MRKFTSFLFVLFMAMVVKAQTEATATLVHTASSYNNHGSSTTYTNLVDSEEEWINNVSKNYYVGIAYAEFSFTIPDGRSIKSASLAWRGINKSNKSRSTEVMLVASGLKLDYEAMPTNTNKIDLSASLIETVNFSAYQTADFKTDVTEAVKTIFDNGQNYIIFKFTNNAGGGRLVGKGAAENYPVLTIETADANAMTTYTVKYVDGEGNEIATAAEYEILAGETASIADENKVAIYTADKKYIYVSCDKESITTVADAVSNVITATFREAKTWSYTANAVDGEGNVLKVLGAGSNLEGETVKVPYNQYILKSGVLYEKGKGISYNNEFNWAFTLSADKQISNLTYKVSSLENVVYFSEAEDIDGMTDVTTGNANTRCSNSVGAYNASETPVELLTLTSGTYTITAQVWGNKNKVTVDGVTTEVPVPLYVQCGNETLEVGTQGYLTSGSKEFTVTENAKVIIPKAGSSGSSPKCIDWILIQSAEANSLLVVEDGKNLDVEGSYGSATYTRSIAAGAYGTICLPFAPDAASRVAYNFYELYAASTVNGTVGEVTFTKVPAPEANKPYIYCLADKNATEAPAITGGATEVSAEAETTIISDWQMVGSFKAETVDCTGKAIYALNGTTQKLMKVTQSLSVPAYRAYIEGTSSQLNLQMLTVRISGPTGIEQISAADVEGLLPATIYDLMGRPVQNPQKGHLYIQGGKKTIY